MPNVRIIAKGQRGDSITKMKVNLTPEQSSTPSLMPETNTVFLSRATEGTGELMKLVGGTVAWNQLCPLWSAGSTSTVNGVTRTVNADGSYTFTNTATANANLNYDSSAFKFTAGHVYYLHGASGGSSNTYQNVVTGYNAYTRDDALFKPTTDKTEHFRLAVINGATVNLTFSPYVIDLTSYLNPTIADYVYSLEQATAGSGIAWLKSYDLIDDQYHAYSVPTLQSVEATAHVVVGKNLLPIATSSDLYTLHGVTASFGDDGSITLNGTQTTEAGYIRVAFPTPFKVQQYAVSMFNATANSGIEFSLRGNVNYNSVGMWHRLNSANNTFVGTPTGEAYYWQFQINVGAVFNNFKISPMMVSGSTPATAYKPYMRNTYPFGTTTLRGIQKLDDNGNLYYYGDTYEWDGTVTRKYGVVDLGTLNWVGNTANQVFWCGFPQMKRPCGLKCAKYPQDFATNVSLVADKTIWNEKYAFAPDNLIIRDTDYSVLDAPAFKTAMSGVMLVYELATPTTESADPFTAVQTVEDGGTEEFTTTNGVPVGVKGRFANAVPMEGVDSFTVTANDGATHTYPVTLSEEVYRGYIDMLTGEAVSEAASIAEYNGETINAPWLSSLDVYAAGATPTNGAQVVYPITPEEVTATITGDPSELGTVTSATSTKGTVEWSAMAPLDGKCIVRVVS